MSSSGDLVGPGSLVVGDSARSTGPVSHATSGALTGQIGSVAGTSARFRAFSTSGALTGQIGSVAGSASRYKTHDSSGSLTGSIGGVVGASARFRTFDTAGSLTGQGSAISGSASLTHVAQTHATSGALVGVGSEVTGSAATPQKKPDFELVHGWIRDKKVKHLDGDRRSQEQIDEERVRLGIIPPKAKKIIAKVAQGYAQGGQDGLTDDEKQQALAKVLAKAEIAWNAFYWDLLREQEEQQRVALIRDALERAGIYAQAARQAEIQRQLEAEEEEATQILLMMMDM